MNKATNNEIDLLLRKLAHRERGDFADAAEQSAAQQEQQHLDADELNAYSENAIPLATRAFYTEHLADCAACRKLVAQLSLASGASISASSLETKAPSTIKKYLAKLFAPRVLRYAGPAFAVIAVLAIALILNRQKPSGDYLAENQQRSTAQPVQSKEGPQSDAAFDTPAAKSDAVAGGRKVESRPNNGTHPEERQQEQAATKQEQAATRQEQAANKPKALDSATRADKFQDAPVVAQPAVAREPATTTAATPVSKPTINGRIESNNDLAKQKKPASPKDQEAESKEEDRKSDEPAPPPKPETFRVGEKGALGGGIRSSASRDSRRESADKSSKEDKSRKEEDEGRTVVGHHFRRQNGVWVDAAYDSSRSTVNVSRGSEQYQALVADEPAIRTIAEQLDGEVIVVWKGRAYRIR